MHKQLLQAFVPIIELINMAFKNIRFDSFLVMCIKQKPVKHQFSRQETTMIWSEIRYYTKFQIFKIL